MSDLKVGETVEVKGSGIKPYIVKNTGGEAYTCTCPAWRNQNAAPERRTCKHIRSIRGGDAEDLRISASVAPTLPTEPINSGKSKIIEAPEGSNDVYKVLLAQSWNRCIDPTGYWMSEKLDGVRAIWNGKEFVSRLGHKFYAPKWFHLPIIDKLILDGELWIGRKQFQKTVSIVRRQDEGEGWKDVKYLIFDLPEEYGHFEQRQKVLDNLFKNHWDDDENAQHLRLVSQQLCNGVEHLMERLRAVEKIGGEGLMLRQPKSLYEHGRSSTLLKVKSFKDDEATVTGYYDGKGRHKGRIGGIEVKLANGKEFKLGTGFTDVERESPPPIGSTITFKYQELTDDGIPRFPAYIGLCVDKKVSKPRKSKDDNKEI